MFYLLNITEPRRSMFEPHEIASSKSPLIPKDKSLLEDAYNAHLNPFLMTIIRSFTLNILHLNKVKSVHNQLIKNRGDSCDESRLKYIKKQIFSLSVIY